MKLNLKEKIKRHKGKTLVAILAASLLGVTIVKDNVHFGSVTLNNPKRNQYMFGSMFVTTAYGEENSETVETTEELIERLGYGKIRIEDMSISELVRITTYSEIIINNPFLEDKEKYQKEFAKIMRPFYEELDRREREYREINEELKKNDMLEAIVKKEMID